MENQQLRGGISTTEKLVEEPVKTDFWYEVELIVFKVGSIGLVVHAGSDSGASLKGQRFMYQRRWTGKTGKVTKLNERSPIRFAWGKL